MLLALRHGSVSGYTDDISLSAATGGKDTFDLSKFFVEKISAIPFDYKIYVRGPRAMSEATKSRSINIQLSNQLSLVSSSIIKDEISFTCGIEAVDEEIWRYNDVDKKKLMDKYLYFVYRTSGYVAANQGFSRLVQALFNEIQAFYGACLAHDILYSDVRRGGVTPIVMGVETSSGNAINFVASMESDLVSATYFPSYKLKSYYKKNDSFVKDIDKVIRFFKCNSPKLKTAATWLLRAKLSQQPIDRVLEAAITLEVLLGDQKMADRVGLTKLMGNRCAYALAKSSAERDELIEFFNRFYKLRSEIVHAGRFSHSEEDIEIVARGMRLASQMLVHEQEIDECTV